MIKQDEIELFDPQVRLWLKKNGIPEENYRRLSLFNKGLLCNLVCKPTYVASERQHRDLYQNLIQPEGREGAAISSMTGEELQKFFSPLSPGEKLNYLRKF